jgi:hypothetical protein
MVVAQANGLLDLWEKIDSPGGIKEFQRKRGMLYGGIKAIS